MSQEILQIVREKGVLLEKEVFDFLSSFSDSSFARSFLDALERNTNQKMVTRSLIQKHSSFVQSFAFSLPSHMQSVFQHAIAPLGVSVIVKSNVKQAEPLAAASSRADYQIHYAKTTCDKKITVQDFVGHFRARYKEIQSILLQRSGLDQLISINKLSSIRQKFALIGMVSEKRQTKNKNLIVTFEDLTGKIPVLFKASSEVFSSAKELQLDEVVAIRCSGSNELVMGYEIIFPEAAILTKTKFDNDCGLAFISDIHVGSHKFLLEEFEHFVEWINSDNDIAKTIKYLFIVGDAVDGVGVFPGQERLLAIKTLKGQYDAFAEYLKRIPLRITIFMCPGQHDASRVPEPQPIVDRSYAGALYDIPNLILVSNPCLVKLLEGNKEFKVQMYHGASIHAFINNIEELRLIKAHKHPARAVKHMLKRRHLAPSHGISASVVYVPNAERDPMVISETPDIICTGEVHRLDIERHNGILIMTGSCWQAQTEFEEKIGNIPDPCKVPVFNIKTYELKILDFSKPLDG